MCIEQIELPAKLLDYFLWSNKSNINQYVYLHLYVYECIHDCIHSHTRTAFLGAGVYTHAHTHERACRALLNEGCSNASVLSNHVAGSAHTCTHTWTYTYTHTHTCAQTTILKDEAAAGMSSPGSHSHSLTTPPFVDDIYNGRPIYESRKRFALRNCSQEKRVSRVYPSIGCF